MPHATDPFALSSSLSSTPVRPLGEILIALGVEPQDVLLALHEQELGDRRRVGDILLAAGAAAREEVARALRIQQRAHPQAQPSRPNGRRLGDILATLGAISPEDATVANYQQELGDTRPLGEILVDHGR